MSTAGEAPLAAETRTRIEQIMIGGRETSLATLEHGPVRVRILGYGATVVSVECPDREGRVENIVLGFETPERYLGEHPYFGSTIGRYANRIRDARFELDGREVRLVANENGHQLHGGPDGFHRAWFACEPIDGGVAFTRTSPDGEGGFPGNLRVRVEFRLEKSGTGPVSEKTGTGTDSGKPVPVPDFRKTVPVPDFELRIDLLAETDRATVVSLTHHGYWRLGGTDVRSQVLQIHADRYVALDDEGIPTGDVRDVAGTAFDFREPRVIGEQIGDSEVEGRLGYDHPFAVGGKTSDTRFVATLLDKTSGRRLDVRTTEPVLHLYTGQLLDPAATGHRPFSALCLETGQAPDVPNQPNLGSARLDPGHPYRHTVIYGFRLSR